jgi:hypothetical protein
MLGSPVSPLRRRRLRRNLVVLALVPGSLLTVVAGAVFRVAAGAVYVLADAVLGATHVTEHEGDIISQVAQAVVQGIGLAKLRETIFPYSHAGGGDRQGRRPVAARQAHAAAAERIRDLLSHPPLNGVAP